MPRFVLLEHDHPVLHWDFMLEVDGTLRTWRFDRIPTEEATFTAVALPDHRLAYLDYEGPVSGHRGSVQRMDRGHYSTLELGTTDWTVRIDGERLRGTCALKRTAGADQSWHCHWVPDSAGRS